MRGLSARRVVAVAVVVVLLVAFAVRLGFEARVDRFRAGSNEPAPVAASAEGERPSRAAPRRRAPVSDPSPMQDVQAAERIAPPAPVPDDAVALDELPSVEVEVRRADGTPAAAFTVYALAEGTPGLDGDRPWELVPNAETDGEGVAHVHVSAAGVYDIGAYDLAFTHAIAESVRVPAPERLHITLPPVERVTFEEHGELPADGSFPVTIGTVDDVAQARLPGRGQLPRTCVSLSREAGRAPLLYAPVGFPLAAGLWTAKHESLTLEPRRFSPPATVVVTWARRLRVALEGRFVPEDVAWRTPAVVTVRFAWGDDAWPDVETFRDHVPADTPLGSRTADVSAYVGRRKGRVTWSGPGIAPGAAVYEIRDGESAVTVPVLLRVEDPTSLANPQSWVRVTKGALTAVAGPKLWTLDADGYAQDSDVELGERVELEPEITWVMGTGSDGVVAGPVRAQPGAETTLRLTRGGFLVVVPAAVLPAAAGNPTIRRADGAPILAMRAEDDTWECGFDVRVRAGAVFGPFEPGPVKFLLVVAGGRAVEVTATVRAGAYETLRVPNR